MLRLQPNLLILLFVGLLAGTLHSQTAEDPLEGDGSSDISIGSDILPVSSANDTEKNDNETGQNEDEDNGPPWAERNHLFWNIGLGGSTPIGIELCAGMGFCHGLLGVDLDYDYHHEFTWNVFPSEYQKIISLLVGPAFRLRWFRIHLATGISLMNFRSRGDIDSVYYSRCESFCLGAKDIYYHEELKGNIASWPVAVKWYYARKALGVGMKFQANVNGHHPSCSIGAMGYMLLANTPSNRKN
jgi:hypothetical protein